MAEQQAVAPLRADRTRRK